MTEFERVMMTRDEMSRTEAKEERQRARAELYEMLSLGCSYEDVEDMLADDYGLEMDYLLDLF